MSKHKDPRAPGYHETVTVTFDGMDNVSDPMKAEAVLVVNIDPGDKKRHAMRAGRVTILAGSFHSGWSNPYNPQEAYFVDGSNLKRRNLDGTVSVCKADLIPGLELCYCQVNDVVCYSNGIQFGILGNGLDTPPFTPPLYYAVNGIMTPSLKRRMVAGKAMAFYNGRLYALVDNYEGGGGCSLVCSDTFETPGWLESMDTRQNIVANFDGSGKGLVRVDNGLYVSAGEETFFLLMADAVLGGGLKEQLSVVPYPMVPGTAYPFEGKLIGKPGNVFFVTTTRGICLGENGGAFTNLTQDKVSFVTGERGTAIMREQNGQVHYVVSMQGDGIAYNPFASRNMEEEAGDTDIPGVGFNPIQY